MSTPPQVVITSYEVISCFGVGREAFRNGLRQSAGIPSDIKLFSTDGIPCRKAYSVPDFQPEKYLGTKGLRYLDRSTVLLLTASKLLLQTDRNSDLNTEHVVIGAEFGGLHSIFQFEFDSMIEGVNYVSPMDFPNTVINSPASRVNIYHRIGGLSATISTGFTASVDAIAYARNLIRNGQAEVLLVGGVTELSQEIYFAHYLLGLLAGSNELDAEIMRPFDKKRKGVVLGEGSVLIVLESLEHAKRNNRKILAEIAGIGTFFSPSGFHYSNPVVEGAKGSMLRALRDANITPGDVDYVCCSSNGSRVGDRVELSALAQVFKNADGRLAIGSIKSATGECCGTSGILQVAATLESMRDDIVLPTHHYEDVDNDIRKVGVITNHIVNKNISVAVINSFDCFGFHSSVALRAYKD